MKRFFVLFTIMLLPFSLLAETEEARASLLRFAGNIHQFNKNVPQEKVYLQFDNTCYYSGETMWFKAFIVNSTTHERALSKVLYVDLLSPNGVLLKQEKLKIVAGQADGSFQLVDVSTSQARSLRGMLNYPSGFYEVRAYTSNMLNFSEEAIFSRVFAVYDKPKEEGNFYEESPVISIQESYVEQYRPKPIEYKKLNVSFFPEGGNIIEGVPCDIAFKVTDESGYGVDATLRLNESKETISTIHDGMGIFRYTSNESLEETITVISGSTEKKEKLPKAISSGYTMHTEYASNDSLLLTVFRTPDLLPQLLGISLTCRGEIMAFETVMPDVSGTTLSINLKGVPEGVCRVTLYDVNGQNLSSRTIYHKNKTLSPIISYSSDKHDYDFLEPIHLSLKLTDSNGNPFRDRFCLAVRDVRGMGNSYSDDIRTYMLLSSDLKGLIEHPQYYFEAEDSLHTLALDLLMLVQGWERYDWSLITGQKQYLEKHRLESALSINGWILNPAGRKPLNNVEVMAAVMPSDKMKTELFSYRTDSTGYFGFDLTNEFYNSARLTISTNTEKDRLVGTTARILFERSMFPSIRSYYAGETIFESLKRNMSTKNKSLLNEDDDLYPTVINVDKGFLLPDVIVEASRKYIDYYTFKSFDVTKDIELELDKANYSTDVIGYLIDKGYQIISTEDDMLIDGVDAFFYVHNSKKVVNQGIYEDPLLIDTKNIVSINVFNKTLTKREAYSLAPLLTDYMDKTLQNVIEDPDLYKHVRMVDVLLKEEYEIATRKELMNIDKRVTSIQGYSKPYYFYSPTYPDGPVIGAEDYRRTLYWEPNVVVDSVGQAEIEFYNNSISSHFNISAAGMTANGTPYLLNDDL